MKKNVVIILVNYNSYDDTKACLQSISAIDHLKPIVVLVDNNSKEREILKSLNNIYDSLHIIYNDENVGFGRANNEGIEWALKNVDFEYLLLLNNDTLIESDSIDYLIEPFSQDPEIGITTGKIMYESNKNLVWYGGGNIDYRRGWPRIDDYNKYPTEKGANESKYVSFVSGCVMMFSKKSIKKIKGFDDDIFMYCEDLELSMRAKKKNIKCWYESNAIIYHKVQGSFSKKGAHGFNKSNPNLTFLFYQMKKNQWIVMQKHLEKWKFVIFNCLFWSELSYRMFQFVSWGRPDLIKITFKIGYDVLKYRLNLSK